MDFIQQLNAKHQTTSWQGKLSQLSPQSLRRMSSPQPIKTAGGGAGSNTGILGRLKQTWQRRQQDSNGTDFSSFTAFGQPLKDCPVSPDNKVCFKQDKHAQKAVHFVVVAAASATGGRVLCARGGGARADSRRDLQVLTCRTCQSFL